MDVFTEIRNALREADNVLVVTHVSPDGDALGAITAMGQALIQLDKNPTLACDDGTIDQFTFLPLADQIHSKPDYRVAYDLLIALDCGDERRMGNVFHNLPQPHPPIINIDHHVTNTLFGAINLVDSGSNSTTEILAYLFPKIGVTITADIAKSLLTGLVTDTLGFRTSSVTANTLKVAADLMEAGANLYDVMLQALTLKPLSTLLMWRTGLNHMRLEDGIAWTSIPYAEQEALGYDNPSAHGLGNLLSDVKQVAISVVLTEKEDGRVTVGFRTRPPYNVADLAAELGGGGHRLAAGCTLKGELAEVESLVIAKTRIALRAQREGDHDQH